VVMRNDSSRSHQPRFLVTQRRSFDDRTRPTRRFVMLSALGLTAQGRICGLARGRVASSYG